MQIRAKETRASLAMVRAVVAEYGFTAQQVFPWKPEPVQLVKGLRGITADAALRLAAFCGTDAQAQAAV